MGLERVPVPEFVPCAFRYAFRYTVRGNVGSVYRILFGSGILVTRV